jgi:hypothetical protein
MSRGLKLALWIGLSVLAGMLIIASRAGKRDLTDS